MLVAPDYLLLFDFIERRKDTNKQENTIGAELKHVHTSFTNVRMEDNGNVYFENKSHLNSPTRHESKTTYGPQ
jgi:GTP-dependent phosphoenolpyruvate carboxykinase